MSLFHNIDYALFVRPHNLEIYDLYSSKVFKIDFPETILNYQEIGSKEKFEELVSGLIKKEKLFNKKAIIVLSEETVFEKVATTDEISKNPQLITSIFEEIPLTASELGKKSLISKTETKIWGTNKTIFEEIKKIVETNGWRISAVVPMNAFPKFKGQKEFQGSMFREIVSNKNYLHQVDFLNENNSVNPGKNINFVSILLILIVMIGSGFGFYYFKGYQYLFKINLKKNIKPTPTIVKTQAIVNTPTSIAKKINLKDYKIIILNGSGKKGEAAALQTQLEDKGFIVSKTDNADNSDYQKTLISATKDVSKDYLNVLKIVLNKTYEVEDKIATVGADIEVEIIIGKNIR